MKNFQGKGRLKGSRSKVKLIRSKKVDPGKDGATRKFLAIFKAEVVIKKLIEHQKYLWGERFG